MTDPEDPLSTKKSRLHVIIIACVLLLIVIGVTIGLTIVNYAIEPKTEPENTSIVVPTELPVVTGSLLFNGEVGYNVYLNGTFIGKLTSPSQIFTSISPGNYTLMAEFCGVTGSIPITIKADMMSSASIGLSKNQMLVRMAKVLNWSKPYPYTPFD